MEEIYLNEYKKKIGELSDEEKKLHDLHLKKIAEGSVYGPQVGYSEIDKPWLKNYTEAEILGDVAKCTCYEMLYNSNKDRKNQKAFEYLGRSYTYGEFFELIEKTKKSLVSSGVTAGEVVTICSITTPEVLALFYALNRIGAIPNFVDVRYPAETIKNYLVESKSERVFTLDLVMHLFDKIIDDIPAKEVIYINPANGSNKILGTLNSISTKMKKLVSKNAKYVSWEKFSKRNNRDVEDFKYVYKYPAAIVHTGGTTGVPKGVSISNDAFNSIVYQVKTARTHERPNWKFLNIMPPFIAYGLGLGLYAPLILGWETIIIPKFDADQFGKLLLKHKPNGVMGVPAYWFKIMNNPKYKDIDLSFLEDVLVGGDKTPSAIEMQINDFLERHNSVARLHKGYSMTEASALATFSNDYANKPESVGVPLVKTNIAVVEPGTQKSVPTGEVGEICIQSTNLMNEYVDNKEETDKVLQQHPDGVYVHSGDIGRVDEDGFIFVEDRIKRMIIRSGFKVFPTEIEKRILSLDFVEMCAVIGVHDDIDVNAPKVFFTLKNGANISKEEAEKKVMEFTVNADLPPYFMPVEYEMIDEMPLTRIGKVDYDKLKEYDNYNKSSTGRTR
ncbi:MAG: acyl--CoA ligase [Bacilli bacterium]|nr:acyl--CoA ligase [Bacilli bacterium]